MGARARDPLREALIEAGRIRLRPIMMTTIALIAGMIPVALERGEGTDFRAPLGRAAIGGVITFDPAGNTNSVRDPGQLQGVGVGEVSAANAGTSSSAGGRAGAVTGVRDYR